MTMSVPAVCAFSPESLYDGVRSAMTALCRVSKKEEICLTDLYIKFKIDMLYYIY